MADFAFTITESESMVDLDEYLDYLIVERCNEIYYKLVDHNTEYKALQSQLEGCFKELLQMIPEPAQNIVNEKLWIIIGSLEMLLPRITYKQAVKDVLRLKEWV